MMLVQDSGSSGDPAKLREQKMMADTSKGNFAGTLVVRSLMTLPPRDVLYDGVRQRIRQQTNELAT
jgi:hypothetical protein